MTHEATLLGRSFGEQELRTLPEFDGIAQHWADHWSEQFTWFGIWPWLTRERSVRFHSLPKSRALPTSTRDDHTILHRYRTILGSLFEADEELIVIAAARSSSARRMPRRRRPLSPGLRRLLPDAHWMGYRRVGGDDGYDCWANLWIQPLTLSHPIFDELLLASCVYAEDVTFTTSDCRRVFAPYEGGVDVCVESIEVRDALLTRFPDWLSPQREWEPREASGTGEAR